jgi:nitrilase
MGQRDHDKLAVREPFGDGAVQSFLAQSARELELWIVGGTLPLATRSDAHVRNTSLAYSPRGECVARYDKIHLFKYDNGREQYDESRVIEAGAAPQVFTLPSRDGHAWRVGLSVCYDLRFPELYRALGADLLLVPSAFTHTTGQAHWELLLRARAVENLAFVLAPAQGGRHDNGRRTWGHSMVVDPWGEVLAVREQEGAGVVLADIDAQRLAQVRRQLPALEHRVL